MIRERLSEMTRRERMFLIWGGGLALLILVYGLVAGADRYSSRLRDLDRLAQKKQQDLQALLGLTQNYEGLKRDVGQLEGKIDRDQGTFSLLAFLETTAAATDLRSKIASIKPQPLATVDIYRETSVEVRIENVTLEQVVRFLSALEAAPHFIKVKNVHLRTRFADARFMDATLLIASFEKG